MDGSTSLPLSGRGVASIAVKQLQHSDGKLNPSSIGERRGRRPRIAAGAIRQKPEAILLGEEVPPSEAESMVDSPTNLHVNFLPMTVTDEELAERFSTAVGPVKSARVMRKLDDPANRSKGYGFVLMWTRADAVRAVELMQGHQWENKRLAVTIAFARPGPPKGEADRGDAVGKPADPQKKGSTTPPASDAPDGSKAMPDATATAVLPHDQQQQQQQSKRATPKGATSPSARRTIRVSPVDYDCTLARLSAVFEVFGTLTAVQVLPDDSAAASYETEGSANAARKALHGVRVPQLSRLRHIRVLVVKDEDATNPRPSTTTGRLSPSKTVGTSRRGGEQSSMVPLTSESSGAFFPPAKTTSVAPSPTTTTQQPLRGTLPATAAATPASNNGEVERPRYTPTAKKAPPKAARRTTALLPLSAPPSSSSNGATPITATAAPPPMMDHDDVRGSSPAQPPSNNHQPPQQDMMQQQHRQNHPYAASVMSPVSPLADHMPSTTTTTPPPCRYCADGATTIVLHNMPLDDVPCEIKLNEVLGRIGYFRYWECWGDGRATATFADFTLAQAAVELLYLTDFHADIYDCVSGMTQSELRRAQQQQQLPPAGSRL